ncbi:hypothetical protein BS78_06G265000 [Paspalum vaginatum]|nr:hypothetical protein BS78_06G265000 [Paspalum vaginatum]
MLFEAKLSVIPSTCCRSRSNKVALPVPPMQMAREVVEWETRAEPPVIATVRCSPDPMLVEAELPVVSSSRGSARGSEAPACPTTATQEPVGDTLGPRVKGCALTLAECTAPTEGRPAEPSPETAGAPEPGVHAKSVVSPRLCLDAAWPVMESEADRCRDATVREESQSSAIDERPLTTVILMASSPAEEQGTWANLTPTAVLAWRSWEPGPLNLTVLAADEPTVEELGQAGVRASPCSTLAGST